jgi:hypothetical protein
VERHLRNPHLRPRRGTEVSSAPGIGWDPKLASISELRGSLSDRLEIRRYEEQHQMPSYWYANIHH